MLAALDAAYVAPIEVGLVGQPLLRHAQFAACGANSLPKNVEIRVHLIKSRESGVIVHGV